MWPLGPSRFDAWLWAGALALGAVGTLIARAAGARLGAALTLGVGLLIIGVLGGLLWQERDRRFPDAGDEGAQATPPPAASVPRRGGVRTKR